MSVAGDLVTLFFSEFTINWATMATVVRVQEDPDDSGKPGLLIATVNGANKENVRWFWPIKPAIGSRCIILFGDNNASRAVAIGFNKIAKIKTKVAELCEVEVDDQGFKIDHSQLLSVIAKPTEGKLTLKNGPTLEVALDSIQNKINFKGKVEVGDATISGVDTNALETWMNEIVTSLQALYTAIQTSPVTPMDGGATYKSGLAGAISSKPIPSVPTGLKVSNLKYGKT
ncbi:hypothetical protein FH581_022110 [Leptospira weilii]|uniref:hypothetical protein n=1 Tax=Leptospira weilii TaxID=28184 RepID=UPI00201B629F|nr:hypothetical protein [Leptospira weilii]UPY76745.1 hypothetical protein FH581_024350 [Leptospira weilii]UPY79551.1 hypothetical protein FH581_012140 [Leptospira weilii]UPY80283.1 hypothetical protein FH581_019985 [Leptospira weilii]UPY80443.1 hypothetical protein FH581_020355 [Leptospira weilii]UPY80780.1 hypothetical protein FH581_022110 [Leptospira weilii]